MACKAELGFNPSQHISLRELNSANLGCGHRCLFQLLEHRSYVLVFVVVGRWPWNDHDQRIRALPVSAITFEAEVDLDYLLNRVI